MYLDKDDNLDILLSQCGPEDALTKILTDELTEQINEEILNLVFEPWRKTAPEPCWYSTRGIYLGEWDGFWKNNFGVVVMDPNKSLILTPLWIQI